MKKIAIVLDASGSIGNLVEVFTLDHELRPVTLRTIGGCDPEKLRELLTQFEEVYFFTDGLVPLNWDIILNPKIRVVKVS